MYIFYFLFQCECRETGRKNTSSIPSHAPHANKIDPYHLLYLGTCGNAVVEKTISKGVGTIL